MKKTTNQVWVYENDSGFNSVTFYKEDDLQHVFYRATQQSIGRLSKYIASSSEWSVRPWTAGQIGWTAIRDEKEVMPKTKHST